MTESDHSSANAEKIEREAQEWRMRLTAGEATTEDADALHRWRSISRAHRRAFAEANLLWDKLHHGALQPSLRAAAQRQYRPTRRTIVGGAVAAAGAMAVVAGVRPPLSLWPSLMELGADYRTARGQ